MAIEMIESASSIDNSSLKQILLNKENFRFDISGQRNYVWGINRRSLLIQSLLMNYSTGLVTANVTSDGKIEIIDGQQRVYTVIKYLSNEFKLCKLEELELKGIDGKYKTYDISDKYFREQDVEIQNALLTSIIRIEKYSNLTDSQENEIMIRLNNGKALTNIERTRMNSYGSIGNFVDDISNMELIKMKLYITERSRNLLADEKVVYQTIAIECGVDVSLNNFLGISDEIKEKFDDDIRKRVQDKYDYLEMAIPARMKWLNYNSFVVIYSLVGTAIKRDIKPRKFFEMLDEYFDDKPNGYSSKGFSNNKVLERTKLLKRYLYGNKKELV